MEQRCFAKVHTTTCLVFSELPSHTMRRLKRQEAEAKAEEHAKLDNDRSKKNLQTPEADNHGAFTVGMSAEGRKRARRVAPLPIDLLLNRGTITDEQHTSGLQLAEDFLRSGLNASMKSSLDVQEIRTQMISFGLNINYYAYHEFQAAAEAIHPRYRRLIIQFCCHGEWLKDIKSTIPLYRRVDALQRGLDLLTGHYERRLDASKIKRSFDKHTSNSEK